MSWQTIKHTDIDSWNKKLQQTKAPYYQYPYYTAAVYSSLFSKPVAIQYTVNNEVQAFASVIEFGLFPFKVAILDGGPVLLNDQVNFAEVLEALKLFGKKRRYIYLQVRPIDTLAESYIQQDTAYRQEVYFPYHIKELAELNIYAAPEEKLLAGFKMQGRRKIVLAGRVDYRFHKLSTREELLEVKALFREVQHAKGYQFIPFHVFENIFKNGHQHGLCDIYLASLNNTIVNALIIVKDGQSYYHLSSGIVVRGFKENESPPAKLHFFAMQDCFYNDHKAYYNISHGGSNNLRRFKELFNPVEVPKPPYYTYVINQFMIKLFRKITLERMRRLRVFVHQLRDNLKPSAISAYLLPKRSSQNKKTAEENNITFRAEELASE